jgi:predicted dithiol-disulfide oxidoreductase (DUF899 family)
MFLSYLSAGVNPLKTARRKGSIDSNLDAGSAASPGEFAAMTNADVPTYTREAPGMSAFELSDCIVYHTYTTYARGLDVLWRMY